MEISSNDLRQKYNKLTSQYSQIGQQLPSPSQPAVCQSVPDCEVKEEVSMPERKISSATNDNTADDFISDAGSLVDTKSVEGIHVAVRIRPLSIKEKERGCQPCCHADSGDNSVCIVRSGDRTAYLKSQVENSVMQYKFDTVYDETATQLDVFNCSVKKYIPKVLKGENVTVFAYGATGAGERVSYEQQMNHLNILLPLM